MVKTLLLKLGNGLTSVPKKRMDKKNQIKISPNDQPDYPVNSVINLLTCTTLTKCCTAINAAVNNNDNGKIV